MLHPVIDQIEEDLQNGVPLNDETIFRRLAGALYDGFASQGDFARLAFFTDLHPSAGSSSPCHMIIKGRKRVTEYVQNARKMVISVKILTQRYLCR